MDEEHHIYELHLKSASGPTLSQLLLTVIDEQWTVSFCTFVCPKIYEKSYKKVLDIVSCCSSDTIPST